MVLVLCPSFIGNTAALASQDVHSMLACPSVNASGVSTKRDNETIFLPAENCTPRSPLTDTCILGPMERRRFPAAVMCAQWAFV